MLMYAAIESANGCLLELLKRLKPYPGRIIAADTEVRHSYAVISEDAGLDLLEMSAGEGLVAERDEPVCSRGLLGEEYQAQSNQKGLWKLWEEAQSRKVSVFNTSCLVI